MVQDRRLWTIRSATDTCIPFLKYGWNSWQQSQYSIWSIAPCKHLASKSIFCYFVCWCYFRTRPHAPLTELRLAELKVMRKKTAWRNPYLFDMPICCIVWPPKVLVLQHQLCERSAAYANWKETPAALKSAFGLELQAFRAATMFDLYCRLASHPLWTTGYKIQMDMERKLDLCDQIENLNNSVNHGTSVPFFKYLWNLDSSRNVRSDL